MLDASAGGHPLSIASMDHPSISGAVAMLDRPLNYECNRLDAAMWVKREYSLGRPILGHQDEGIGERGVRCVDQTARDVQRLVPIRTGDRRCALLLEQTSVWGCSSRIPLKRRLVRGLTMHAAKFVLANDPADEMQFNSGQRAAELLHRTAVRE
jgi:hypothetical protein